MPVSDAADAGGTASDLPQAGGSVSDSPGTPVLYTADIEGLTDYFESPVIWAGTKRIVSVHVSDFVPADLDVPMMLQVMVLTRRTGGPWIVGIPISLASALISPLFVDGQGGKNSVALDTMPYTVLDEFRVIVQLLEVAGLAYSFSPTFPDPDIPGSNLSLQGQLPGGFFNLFGVEMNDPGAPSQMLSTTIVDDPDRPGHYLVDVELGTDAAGVIETALADLPYSFGNLNSPLGYGESNTPVTPLPAAIPYAPFSGGSPGATSPADLTVTVR